MKSHFITFDELWQRPAKTELHAFNQLKKIDDLDNDYCYIAYPWATLIDFLQTGKPIPEELITAFEKIKIEATKAAEIKKVITVCQHIFASRYISIFKACKVSTLYWPHCTTAEPEIGGIKIKPFPLFAVHEPSANEIKSAKHIANRSIKASFIGAYDSRYYLTEIRKAIFSIPEVSPEGYLIIARDNWHFQEDVYTRQISGKDLDDAVKERKSKEELEYRNTIQESLFSLCPSGSGPNSIRLWETLAFNSIPIIFADTLSLPGGVQDWIEASVFMSEKTTRDEIINLVDSHTLKSKGELEAKAEAVTRIYKRYGNNCFVWDIVNEQNEPRIFVEATLASKRYQPAVPAKEIEPSTSTSSQRKETYSSLVIDPGLKDTGSHHDKINRGIIDKINKAVVLCHIQSKSNSTKFSYETRAVFQKSVYDEKSSFKTKEYTAQFSGYAKTIAKELRTLPDIKSLYVHTATASLIQGLASAIQISQKERGGIQTVYLQLMFNPYSLLDSRTQETSLKSDSRYAVAIRKLVDVCTENSITLCIETSNSVFQDQYRKLLGSKIVGVHPHVFANSRSTGVKDQIGANTEILLHSGDPRPGKGLEWLGNSLQEIINRTDHNKKLSIHSGVLRYPSAFPEIQEALQSIQSIATRNPNRIRFTMGHLDDGEWEALVSTCSRAYLLHNPEYYRNRTSGNFFDILMESIGSIPIYLTSRTLSSDIAQREMLTHGQITYGDTNDLVKSINDVSVDPPCSGKGFLDFKAFYIDKDHTSHVIQRLTTSNIE